MHYYNVKFYFSDRTMTIAKNLKSKLKPDDFAANLCKMQYCVYKEDDSCKTVNLNLVKEFIVNEAEKAEQQPEKESEEKNGEPPEEKTEEAPAEEKESENE